MTQEMGATGSGRAGGSSGRETMQQSASMLADQAGRTAEAHASKLMTQAGDSLEQMARAVREAGEGVREEQPAIADLAENAAHQVERAAQFLHEHDAAEVVEASSDYARRQPALLVGGGLLLGLALGRVLKTAGRHTDGGGEYTGAYGTGGRSGMPSGRYGTGSTGYGAGATGYGAGSAGYGAAGPRSMDATDPLATGTVVDETVAERSPGTSSASSSTSSSRDRES